MRGGGGGQRKFSPPKINAGVLWSYTRSFSRPLSRVFFLAKCAVYTESSRLMKYASYLFFYNGLNVYENWNWNRTGMFNLQKTNLTIKYIFHSILACIRNIIAYCKYLCVSDGAVRLLLKTRVRTILLNSLIQ